MPTMPRALHNGRVGSREHTFDKPMQLSGSVLEEERPVARRRVWIRVAEAEARSTRPKPCDKYCGDDGDDHANHVLPRPPAHVLSKAGCLASPHERRLRK